MGADGAAACIHLMRAQDDPERRPRPRGGQGDRRPHLTIDKTSVTDWRLALLTHLEDGVPRTFNRIGVELLDKTADILFETTIDEALRRLVHEGWIEHTIAAPILFRVCEPRPRSVVCNPCRDGQHHDCHVGVWVKADGSDPVFCPCDHPRRQRSTRGQLGLPGLGI